MIRDIYANLETIRQLVIINCELSVTVKGEDFMGIAFYGKKGKQIFRLEKVFSYELLETGAIDIFDMAEKFNEMVNKC